MFLSLFKKFFSVLSYLLYPCKRIFCWIKRSRKNSGTFLPLGNKYPESTSIEMQQMVPCDNADLQLEPWDNWDVSGTPGFNQATTAQCNPGSLNNSTYHRPSHHQSDEPEPEINFFEDMQPSIKKTKKIILRKNSGQNKVDNSGRLAASSDILPIQGSELKEWEESSNAWDADEDIDITQEADQAIKNQRRYQRQIENQRKKMEKQTRNKADSFTAIKLS